MSAPAPAPRSASPDDPATAPGGDRAAAPPAADQVAAYQSLYRRFRPQRFSEVLGQEHVVVPLHNAVRAGTVSHAYLFSGPRGTGKTSTARILAKALNCTDPHDGEPCGTCSSCHEITRGTSMDVHELDAASNNGVDAMRDLVSRAALGTPGRTKVYIVDEVHMLSTAASNALLKTLEEPPPHVVFVLATTDPQKVLPTIRSRTQPFEFRLLGPDTLADLLRTVRDAAALGLDDAAVDAAVRRGRGSARDALSILDQVAAGGLVDDEADVLDELADSLADRDTRRALVAVGRAMAAGYDPQRLAGELADHLRQAFLAVVAPEVVTVPSGDRDRIGSLGARMGLAPVVRAMERLGNAQVAMRDAPDPRAHLEVALIRLANPELDDSVAALVERVDRLERLLAAGAATDRGPAGSAAAVGSGGSVAPTGSAGAAAPTGSGTAGASPERAAPGVMGQGAHRGAPASGPSRPGGDPASPTATVAPERPGGPSGPSRDAAAEPAAGPELARRTLGALRRQGITTGQPVADRSAAGAPTAPPPTTPSSGAPAAAPARDVPGGDLAADHRTASPTRDDLVQAWGDHVLAALPGRARARFRMGRFVAVEADTAVFALPNETHRGYCEEVRRDVEEALSAHFGTAVAMRLVVDTEPSSFTGMPAAERPARNEPGGEHEREEPDGRGGPAGDDGAGRPPADAPRADAAPAGAVPAGAVPAGAVPAGRPPAGDVAARRRATPPARPVEPHAAGAARQEDLDDEALLDPEVLRAETAPAGAGLTPQERLKQAFPGAQEA